MLPLYLCALLAAAPVPPVELRAGSAQPDDDITLELTGVVAPARTEAGLYLFGRLGTPAWSLRALLLRSTDGGAHWTEVLPEVEHSEVLFVDFVGCEGRALVGWTTEGPGELTLYASPDCGATWKRRSTLPKAVWSEWPLHMTWKSGRQGTVWLRDMNEENPLPRVLTTRDGGRTWRAAKKPPQAQPPSPPLDSRLARFRALLPKEWRREGSRLVPAH